MASASITVSAGTSIDGSALAHTAAVTLSNNAITTAGCAPPGTLNISVPTGPVSLGFAGAGTSVSGHLGNVEVTDNRDVDPASWTATVACTAFVSGTHTIGASYAADSPGTPTTSSDPTFGTTNVPSLSAVGTSTVTLPLNKQVPDGLWKARLDLASGLTERAAQAAMSFPLDVGSGQPQTTPGPTGPTWWEPWPPGWRSWLPSDSRLFAATIGQSHTDHTRPCHPAITVRVPRIERR
jgi:hypothetical protein